MLPFFVARYGVWFAVFCSLPAWYWVVRSSPLGSVVSPRLWSSWYIAVLATSIGGASVFSGGVGGPIVFFAGLVALVGHALFAHLGRFAALGIGVVLAVATIDLTLDRSIDVAMFIGALLLTGYLPFFVDRLICLEQLQRKHSVVDQLTGCLNRRALHSRSIELEQQSIRTDSGLAAVIFDIDHFKSINDEHGHRRGDRVLAHVAEVTRTHLRRFELVYRVGGEEFAILLPGVDLDRATKIAETVRQAIESSPMDDISITASFGVAEMGAPFSVEAVVELADRRLYAAKRRGRNRVVADDAESLGAELV